MKSFSRVVGVTLPLMLGVAGCTGAGNGMGMEPGTYHHTPQTIEVRIVPKGSPVGDCAVDMKTPRSGVAGGHTCPGLASETDGIACSGPHAGGGGDTIAWQTTGTITILDITWDGASPCVSDPSSTNGWTCELEPRNEDGVFKYDLSYERNGNPGLCDPYVVIAPR